MKKNKMLMHVTIWLNIEDIMSSESQTQKTTYCMIPFIKKCLKQENPQRQKENRYFSGTGKRERMGCKAPFGSYECILELDCGKGCVTFEQYTKKCFI